MSGVALFVCDASFRSGFGHAARCLQIAALMRRAEPTLGVVFQGEYSENARRLLAAKMPDIVFAAPGAPVAAEVALIDRMSNFDDIEACDLGVVTDVAARARATLYLASGFTVPALPVGVRCLGYQPGGVRTPPPGVVWSLDYAPVSSELLIHNDRRRDPGLALIAFGGAPDDSAPRLAAGAVALRPDIHRVRILGSPVNVDQPRLPLRPDQQVEVLRNVPEIGPLLAEAGVVLASFGHLGYEALALGAPLCLLATKVFQAQLADRFAELGIAHTAGIIDSADAAAMAAALDRTLADASGLAHRAQALIDGHGLDRLAALLMDMRGHG